MKILYVLLLPLLVFGFQFDEMPNITKRQNPSIQNDVIQSYNSSIEQVKQSVVNISTQKKISTNNDINLFFNDPFFKQFFGDLYQNMPKDRVERSLGSGVIISKDGYIVTNNHVIDGADKITVSLPSNPKKEYDAKLIGKDPRSDLAVIKINQNNLPYAKLGNSNELLVGDIVFAIGNPFGVGESVTQGIISALNKSNVGINDYENFIQTDAPINPGNSGGALVDSRGALIGINTAIISRTGGNHGIGFAIPSDMVKRIATILIEKGSVERGFLGVGIEDVSDKFSNLYDGKSGAVIVSVDKNSAAAKAGLKIWDLIISVNGKQISGASDLRNIIGQFSPNDVVDIKYIRDKKEYSVKIKLDKAKDSKSSNNAKSDAKSSQNSGLNVEDLTNQVRQMYGIPSSINGVLVSSVADNSSAANAGFQEGDIISQVEDITINNVSDFKEAMKKYKNKTKKVLVYQSSGLNMLLLK